MSSKWKTRKSHIEITLNQRTQIAQIVIHMYNECICIYGPELGSYCFSSKSDVGLVENATENIQGKKQFAKFRMLQIEEGKHVYCIIPW